MRTWQRDRSVRQALDRAGFSVLDEVDSSAAADVSEVICKCIPASPGVVIGKARIIRKKSEYKRIPFGTVVVSKMTRPDVVFGLKNIAAIVTDVGGSLCHAAIVAREMGIPCVVGTKNATNSIQDRSYVSVDGTKGIVTPASSGQRLR